MWAGESAGGEKGIERCWSAAGSLFCPSSARRAERAPSQARIGGRLRLVGPIWECLASPPPAEGPSTKSLRHASRVSSEAAPPHVRAKLSPLQGAARESLDPSLGPLGRILPLRGWHETRILVVLGRTRRLPGHARKDQAREFVTGKLPRSVRGASAPAPFAVAW